ncbi:MAG: hypothetical protein Q8J64_03110 [Thermodesulfovibrionales bacterium]|nr:hypothetical protein [Thermodesulfovibrionales bacterium]
MPKKIKKFPDAQGSAERFKKVDSLLDAMQEGNEFGSIVSLMPTNSDLVPELKRAISEIESIRNRPLICYFANVVRPVPDNDIQSSDDLPFNEMVSKVDTDKSSVDVMVVTPGGAGQQVSQFVNCLRARFDEVDFILPYMCMSAGTLWVLSGDNIWMDSRAYIGPIDPQVRLPDGRFIPAQSLIVLLQAIRKEGEEFLKKGISPPWDLIRLIDNMDARQVGDAITQSDYAIKMATEFLEKYKFKSWITHSSTGAPVTDVEKHDRAQEIATLFCSHDYWKSHAHGITRGIAQNPLRLKINEIESVSDLEKAVRRLWALLYWLFDRGIISKIFISQNYALARSNVIIQKG